MLEEDGPRQNLTAFFRAIFDNSLSIGKCHYLQITALKQDQRPRQRVFNYPDSLDYAIDYASACSAQGWNVYFCIGLLKTSNRTKSNVPVLTTAWADLDETPLDDLRVDPTIVVETSPGKHQAYFVYNDYVSPEEGEDMSKRIAYAHKDTGADPAWDRVRLLRVPYTKNYKSEYRDEDGIHPVVKIVRIESVSYELSDLQDIYDPVGESFNPSGPVYELNRAAVEALPSADEILGNFQHLIPPDVYDYFYQQPPVKGSMPQGKTPSDRLWALEMACFEAGMSREQAYKVARDSACNKYARDNRPDWHLWKEVCKAFSVAEARMGHIFVEEERAAFHVLTDEEIELVQHRTTFIERFIAWAKGRTDAPISFHVGGAIMALSAVLADKVEVLTHYGAVRPNIWVLLLADTTLSRKTTSMGLSMSLVEELNEDVVLATDGTSEGLLQRLSERSGQVSLFFRDEFSGFMAAAKNKEYMSDMVQWLCQLYDGTRVKRTLSRSQVDVRKPVFLLYAAGVETKLFEQLTDEHISNGFLPRFIPIFGITDIKKIRLVGPPREDDFDARDALVQELRQISEKYDQSITIRSGNPNIPNAKFSTPRRAELSQEAWERVQEFQAHLLEFATGHSSQEMLLPCVERLIANVLKVSLLLAASACRHPDKIAIELIDVLHTLYYARNWFDNLILMMNKIGSNAYESQISRILEVVHRYKDGVSRATLMRNFHLTSRVADDLFRTMQDRGDLTASNSEGRGTVYRSTTNKVKVRMGRHRTEKPK